MKILVIGSMNIDTVNMVERLPEKGETILSTHHSTHYGGKGFNQAVAAKRLSGDVVMAGMVGEDEGGENLLSALKEEGIDVNYVGKSNSPSGNANITVDESGDNTIVVYSGANFDVDTEYIKSLNKVMDESNIVLMQLELPLETVTFAAKLAKEKGKTVILNPAPATKIPDELYKHIDYITPNETELLLLSGVEDFDESVKIIKDKGVENVVVTLGEKGSYVSGKEDIYHNGYTVSAIDTTAAGDSFNAALVVGLAEGMPLNEVLSFANGAGAIATTKIGALNSLPKRDEVEKFIKNNK